MRQGGYPPRAPRATRCQASRSGVLRGRCTPCAGRRRRCEHHQYEGAPNRTARGSLDPGHARPPCGLGATRSRGCSRLTSASSRSSGSWALATSSCRLTPRRRPTRSSGCSATRSPSIVLTKSVLRRRVPRDRRHQGHRADPDDQGAQRSRDARGGRRVRGGRGCVLPCRVRSRRPYPRADSTAAGRTLAPSRSPHRPMRAGALAKIERGRQRPTAQGHCHLVPLRGCGRVQQVRGAELVCVPKSLLASEAAAAALRSFRRVRGR